MPKEKNRFEPRLVTIVEAAVLLNMSERWVNYHRAQGTIKSTKKGSAVRIEMVEIDRVSKIDLGPCRPRTINQKARVQTDD